MFFVLPAGFPGRCELRRPMLQRRDVELLSILRMAVEKFSLCCDAFKNDRLFYIHS
jgi:hypothetical protein